MHRPRRSCRCLYINAQHASRITQDLVLAWHGTVATERKLKPHSTQFGGIIAHNAHGESRTLLGRGLRLLLLLLVVFLHGFLHIVNRILHDLASLLINFHFKRPLVNSKSKKTV